jgi:hypothetical protein
MIPVTASGNSVNISTFRSFNTTLRSALGYTGTISTAEVYRALYDNQSGVPTPSAVAFIAGAFGNGTGNTSGTVANKSFEASAHTASAGAGGTITNDGFKATVSTGSGAGTTTNRGIYITGNGGSGGGGTTINYALYSDSPAPSLLSGLLQTAAPATSGAGLRLPHGTAPTSPVDGDMWTTTAGLYVRINGATVGPLS